jgi:hypothetical protein
MMGIVGHDSLDPLAGLREVDELIERCAGDGAPPSIPPLSAGRNPIAARAALAPDLAPPLL